MATTLWLILLNCICNLHWLIWCTARSMLTYNYSSFCTYNFWCSTLIFYIVTDFLPIFNFRFVFIFSIYQNYFQALHCCFMFWNLSFFLFSFPAFSSGVTQRHSAVPFFIPDAFIVTEVNISANQIVCILESSKFSEDTLYLENGERIFCLTYKHPLM